MSKYIKSLNDAELGEIGTKVANLKIIQTKTRFRIPETLTLTSSFYRKLLLVNKIKDPSQFDWNKVNIPVNLQQELFYKINEMFGERLLVIRSSASCEDSPLLSFAGQYSSFLNIKGEKKILNAIRLCYGSLFSKNATVYSKLSGLNMNKEYMAIGIQEVAKISISGVMFTANPVTRNTNEILVEYSKGLGDKIVGGSIVPRLVKINKKKVKCVSQKFLLDIGKMGLEIEKVFKQAQDIEWGYSNGTSYIFQSRPITTLNLTAHHSDLIIKKTKISSGSPTNQGTVTGVFRIIKSNLDYRKIKEGDIIMILNSPSIKLIENINKVGGMIIPGGLLSHFAVIAREFNKPCITLIKNFNYNLHEGANVHLDATKGILYITHKSI